ncbi:MAG TPA: tRNA (guanosine(37)-N1)-methyltransferase TrmD [Bacillota bacterium]|nr:tRNA (guanosine(37)-N1)-methyltransferase TrmD [Bacillota bacterium]
MKIDILTLFPDMFAPLAASIIGKAREKGLLEINIHNIRDYTRDKHKITDDYPFGGGAGMVMKPEPVFRAVEALNDRDKVMPANIILMCPQGTPFSQQLAAELAQEQHLVFLCGHYEGMDERIREGLVTREISIGDYVLTGGELPAMVVVDAVARLLPGVLGESFSAVEESFTEGLLEYPQYTRPREYQGMQVPDILLSGDHEKIRRWRRQQSLKRTLSRRPDLLQEHKLSPEDRKLLKKQFLLHANQVKHK